MYATENSRVFDSRESFVQTRTSLVIWAFERESNIRRHGIEHLEQEGFRVRALSIGADAIQRVKQLNPSLIVIETMMISGAALQLCRAIRSLQSFARTPVVLVSANASEEERVLGLESGADDYINESSSGREVVARVRAVMRRFARQDSSLGIMPPIALPFPKYPSPALDTAIRMGDIEVNAAAMTISVRGTVIVTTNLEFRLLYYLLHNQGRVLTRDQLLDAVWGADFVELRSVDACIRRLRRKIEPEPFRPTYLKTVRGAGYCLRVNVA